MAYASLVVVTKVIDQILPNEHHYSSICTKDQMTSLREKVVRFQEFFEHVSGIPHYSSEVDELESRIRDAAYKMEDMLESILISSFGDEEEEEEDEDEDEVQLSSPPTTLLMLVSGLINCFFWLCQKKSTAPEVEDGVDVQFSSELPTAAEFASCLEEVDLLLGETVEMRNKQVIQEISIYSHDITATSSSSPSRPRSTATDTSVGLDDNLTKILDRITGRPTTFQVVPITGMGGIGKTTLARAVFEHPKTVRRFDVRFWATVSQECNVKEVLQGLLPGKPDWPVGDLIVQVHKQLVGRRYLIILDDVWDEKVWDGVRNAFPNDNNCSRVILTTRLANIATYVIGSSSTHAHQMQLLNEGQSWDLLRETVYGHGVACPGEFEDMGRMVSRSCKGLPLALVVIGGVLKLNNAKDYWEHVATSTKAEATADDDSLLNILSLSYKNLPPQLKACFLYLGMFPEDEEIPTKKLVRLWCAEGFLKPRESKTMEMVAEECLEELLERNLIMVMKKSYNGKMKSSSIHDVLRELSLIQARKEKFLYRYDGSSEIDGDTFLRIVKDQQRRVSFPEFSLDCSISFNSPIRTFRFESSMDYDQLSYIIPQFKLVRVLGTVPWSFSAFRISFRLKNLRYLHLHKEGHGDEGLIVPKSISKLRNLETLYVSGGYTFSSDKMYDLILPVEIWEMPRLRHLLVADEVTMKLPPFPASGLNEDSSVECWSLQTLSGVVNFGDFTPRAIQKLQQNLKKLQIKYQKISYDGDDEKREFSLDNLVNLHNLEDLTIYRHYDGPRVMNIGFPIKLKKLSLGATFLPWEKMTSIGDLIHLQVLKLDWDAFIGEVWEPIEGGFPQLKYLKMEVLFELEEWRVESTHFPSLEKLVIMNCPKLKEVPSDIGDIDTLQKLIVRRADFLDDDKSVGDGFEESVRRIEEEQRSLCNDSLQVIFLSEYQGLRDVGR